MKVKELFSDESRWTRFRMARTPDGEGCLPDNPDASCWCLLGAIEVCYSCYAGSTHFSILYDKIVQDLNLVGDSFILEWNDAPERTFEEVKQLVERLDI